MDPTVNFELHLNQDFYLILVRIFIANEKKKMKDRAGSACRVENASSAARIAAQLSPRQKFRRTQKILVYVFVLNHNKK